MQKLVPEDIESRVAAGAEILKTGGVIAYPTDTVYGLGASLKHTDAIHRIFRIKNRGMDMALPLLLGDISMIENYVSEIPGVALTLIETFLPGALTLVMKKSKVVPDIITGGRETVALRVPGHPLTLSLLKQVETAVTGTSANLSGMPSALTADQVQSQIGHVIDYIIDGGQCPGGIESTIIDVTGELPVILREGALSRTQIRKITPVKSN